MKKAIVAACAGVWLLACTGNIYSKTRPLEFEIHYDSQSKQTYEIKKQMQEAFDELVSGLHAESQSTMVRRNLDHFEVEDRITAAWDDKLILIEGDGAGDRVDGELTQSTYCIEKVQPRSFLQSLFQ